MGAKFGNRPIKVREQTDKSSGTLPLSDFAFFNVFNIKNAKSNRGSVPEFLSGGFELLSVFPRTFGRLSSNFAPPDIVILY